MAIAWLVMALYAGLAAGIGWFWRRRGLGFAAGFLWSVLLTPVLGLAIGLVLRSDSRIADPRARQRRSRRRWLVPAAILFVAFAIICALPMEEGPNPRARMKRARIDVQRIASDGVERFRAVHGRYPTMEEGLPIVIRAGFLRGSSPDGSLRDPWDRPYVYERPGRNHPDRFDVRSHGADGRPGGDGDDADICN